MIKKRSMYAFLAAMVIANTVAGTSVYAAQTQETPTVENKDDTTPTIPGLPEEETEDTGEIGNTEEPGEESEEFIVTQEEYLALKEEISNLNGIIILLTDQLEEAKKQNPDKDTEMLETKIQTLTNALTSLESQVSGLKSTNVNLANKNSSLNGQVNSLSNKNYSLSNQVSTLTNQVSNLRSNNTNLTSQLKNAQDQLAKNQKSIGTNSTNIAPTVNVRTGEAYLGVSSGNSLPTDISRVVAVVGEIKDETIYIENTEVASPQPVEVIDNVVFDFTEEFMEYEREHERLLAKAELGEYTTYSETTVGSSTNGNYNAARRTIQPVETLYRSSFDRFASTLHMTKTEVAFVIELVLGVFLIAILIISMKLMEEKGYITYRNKDRSGGDNDDDEYEYVPVTGTWYSKN